VRAGFAHARITLLTDAALGGLARGTGLFDDVLGFDAGIAFHGRPGARLRLVWALARQVRRARPDAVAVFKGAPVYAAIAAVSGARWRAGLARGAGRRLLTHPLAIEPARHHEDRYLDVVAALGVDPACRVAVEWPNVPSPIAPSVRTRAWPLIGIAPGGARNVKQDTATKRWPVASYVALARGLASAYPDAAFVLLGAASDRAEVDAVRGALPPDRVVDLAGATDLAAARAAIAALDVYVGNDSGLMHVAGTTHTRAVIAFGPTDPRVIAPRTPGLCALWHPAPGAPCYDEVTGAHRPCRAPCCIERVGVGEMRAAVDAALSAAPGAGGRTPAPLGGVA
jgi:heptosyltransferase-2